MPITYDTIATTTLGTATNSITFSGIASTWTDLRLVLSGASGGNAVGLRFNGLSTNLYGMTTLYTSSGDGPYSYSTADATQITISNGVGPDATPYLATADIFSYTSAINKSVLTTLSNNKVSSGSAERAISLWRSTAAITSVTVFGTATDFGAGTMATLYGIKAA